MTAASVLSLCMSLIARSPPDSSRSPHKLSPHRQHRLTPAAGHQHRSACRDRELGRFRPHDHHPVRHRRPPRTPPRVCTYAQAGEHPRTQEMPLLGWSASADARSRLCSLSTPGGSARRYGGRRQRRVLSHSGHFPAGDRSGDGARVGRAAAGRSLRHERCRGARTPAGRSFHAEHGPLAPAGGRMRFRADNAPAAPLKNSATAEHKITTSTRPAV